MGMSGYYVAVEESLVDQIADGTVDMESLDLTDYEELDIDKSWQAIHYMLCGDIADGDPPLGYVVPLIDDQGVNYGDFGAFYLRSAQVQEALDAMQPITHITLRDMYDFDAMAEDEVYPVIEGENAEEFFEYLVDCYDHIHLFFEKVAQDNQAILFYIS